MILLFNDVPSVPNRSVGVYRVATVLRRAGLEVEVIDYLSHWNFETLLNYIDKVGEVDWYGFSGRFHRPQSDIRKTNWMVRRYIHSQNEVDESLFTYLSKEKEDQLIRHLREKNKKIVLGGPNADVIKDLTTELDIICTGYADNSIIAIHNHIVRGEPLISETHNGMIIVNSDLSYPVNDLSNLETEYVDSDFIYEKETFPIEIGRGCIFHCAFCEFAHLGKKPGTYIRPKESIKKDIMDRYQKYGTTRFLFVDDTFNDSTDKLRMIKEIREETNIDFEFWGYCRVDLLAAHPEQVDLISEIGWKSFTIGIETFNRKSGQAVGKGADPEKLKIFLLDLRKRFPNIKLQINLIFGLPHDTEETLRDSVQWFIDHPQITHYVKISALGIKNPEGRLFSSKLAANPEKYGYKIVGKIPHKKLLWETNNLTETRARELVDELQKKLNEIFMDKQYNKNSITELRDEPVRTIDDRGFVRNSLKFMVDEYFRKKLAYRGITNLGK